MVRPLYDSVYIFGIHEPGGEDEMLAADRPGWIVFTEGIGHDVDDFSGRDYRAYSARGLGVISRLNNGYFPQGTIPYRRYYADFAQRCASFVAASHGCKIWIIGNEMNYAIERPQSGHTMFVPDGNEVEVVVSESGELTLTSNGLWARLKQVFRRLVDRGPGVPNASAWPQPPDSTPNVAPPSHPTSPPDDPRFRGHPTRFNTLRRPAHLSFDEPDPIQSDTIVPEAVVHGNIGEVITPALYAECYRLCRDAIHAVPGHEDDQVLIGAVAPWNNQTKYPENPEGDWVQYLQDILFLLGPDGCDGITLHTYTHQADPNLIRSEAKMASPFDNRHFEFRVYQDFMRAIPVNMRHLPVYITETDQDVAWLDRNIGWVQQAYGEINWWNQQPGHQQIRALILYRWPKIDKWYIEGKEGVIEDFRKALVHDYRWGVKIPPPADFVEGDIVATLEVLNLRKTPGFLAKPADDVNAELPMGTRLVVLASQFVPADGLSWWHIRVADAAHDAVGWVAQSSPTGVPLLEAAAPTPSNRDDGHAVEDKIEIAVGRAVRVLELTRLRRSPGDRNEPEADIITEMALGTMANVLKGPQVVDGLAWWLLRAVMDDGRICEGWAAESIPNHGRVLEPVDLEDLPLRGENGSSSSTRFEPGELVITSDFVNLRRTPGYLDKPGDDIVAELPPMTEVTVRANPAMVDGLRWWQVTVVDTHGRLQDGWTAESAPNGVVLLEHASPFPTQSNGAFARGTLIQATTWVRVRRSPGITDKPDHDMVSDFVPATTVYVLDGPQTVDDLSWWYVSGISLTSGPVSGWVAQTAPNGMVLLQHVPDLPGTGIPSARYLGPPFRVRYGISQLWGERPDVYRRFSYDGVPLLGHNGLDFLTPSGTELIAVDDGTVAEAVYNDPSGFGHYVKIRHVWGESLYGHMQRIDVPADAPVRRGQRLGLSDDTGYSGGPHLHFSIRIDPYSRTDGWGGFRDPLPYLNPKVYFLPAHFFSPVADASIAGIAGHQLGHPGGPGMAPDQPGVRRP